MTARFHPLVLLAGLGAAMTMVLPAGAGAATPHRAAVIIDTGTGVKHVCIRFTQDSITGKDALDLANQVDPSVHPVYKDYGGDLGYAVCQLCGVGNDFSDCPGTTYWSYGKAPAGTTTFSTSNRGVSSSQVHDGDVEGWRWGKGGFPPYASVDQVCGTLTTDGTFTPTTVSTGGSPPQPVAATGAAPSGRVVSRPVAPTGNAAAPATAAPSTTTTAPFSIGNFAFATTTTGRPSGTAIARFPKKSSGGGSLVGLGLFGAGAAGLGGWLWWVRRAKRLAP